eukprot:COSAG01_NODE_4221_length_5227_cov_3.990445_4_plen_61_part_00
MSRSRYASREEGLAAEFEGLKQSTSMMAGLERLESPEYDAAKWASLLQEAVASAPVRCQK